MYNYTRTVPQQPPALIVSIEHSVGTETTLSGASGRSRGIMAAPSDLLVEATHGAGLLTGTDG
jgi:hypothetical protein